MEENKIRLVTIKTEIEWSVQLRRENILKIWM